MEKMQCECKETNEFYLTYTNIHNIIRNSHHKMAVTLSYSSGDNVYSSFSSMK